MDDKALAAKLAPLRAKIDALDLQILDLLNQRAQTALEVGVVKHEAHAGGPVLRPDRESQVIRRLIGNNAGPFPGEAVEAVWKEVMSACRGLEQGLSVAYLGPRGSFTELAAFSHFGHAVNALPQDSFDEVFRAVEAGQADVGMIPVENSTEGAVNRSLDLLLHTPLRVQGERSLPIRHCLMTQSGTMDGVVAILAHPQALAQCQDWLARHYPTLPTRPVSSNAEAARLASLDPTLAAIGGEFAAQAWELAIVAESIQDDPQNRTRFLAIGRIDPGPSGRDKTSVILAVPNRAGAVYEMLAPLAENGVSMTRFESRPARNGQWEYYFYVDFLGHCQDANVARALQALESNAAFFKLLGSYPAQ